MMKGQMVVRLKNKGSAVHSLWPQVGIILKLIDISKIKKSLLDKTYGLRAVAVLAEAYHAEIELFKGGY